MSRTTRAKACWSSSLSSRPSMSAPAFCSTQSRQRSTTRSPLFGAALAGQPLAHHQRHGLLDRRIGLVAHVGEVGLGELVLEHGAEIVGDAPHGARADRLDARLLDGVEDGARLLALRRQPGVDADVVAGAPQRHGIAQPAGDRDVVARRLLRQLRQPRAVAGQRRLVLGEGDFQLVVAGDRAHADADGALEIVRLAVAARFCA